MPPTPSTTATASPSPRRPPFFSEPPTRSDGPSPTKRRKIVTPGPEYAASVSSVSSISAANPQLDAERRSASRRVLNVWSTLADKYTRHLDEDDIVDLRTGDLVRDRGVLSGTARTWDIGCFADAEEDGTAEPEGNGDESDDELGGWGSGSELDHQFKLINVPPVQELDPEDAEDLREFLAAEEARKAEHGDDDDASLGETSDDGNDSQGADDGDVDSFDPDTDDSIVEVEAGSALALSEEESPDELEGYDDTVGEGAILYEIGSDVAESTPKPLVLKQERIAKTPSLQLPPLRRPQTPAQLRTPPLSRSSAIPPHVPSRRLSLNLPPPKLPRAASFNKGKQPESRPPLAVEPPAASASSPPKTKLKTTDRRTPFITPIKNIVPEVVISSRRRASTVGPQAANKDEGMPANLRGLVPSTSLPILKKPRTIGSPAKRRARSSSPSKFARASELSDIDSRHSSQSSSPVPPPQRARRKRVLSEDEDEQEVGRSFAPQDAENEVSLPCQTSSHSGRSSPLRHSQVPHPHAHALHPNAHTSHPHARALSAAPDGWPPYARYTSAAPSHYTPMSAPDPVAPPPHLDIIVERVMQSLGYLPNPVGSHLGWPHTAPFGLPPPTHSPASIPPSYSHYPQLSQLHPPTPLYTSPYPYHPQAHSPWVLPHYPLPYTPSANPHSQPPPTSSASSFAAGPPTSPASSPLSGKGKGTGKNKRVSFPDEMPEYEGHKGKEEEKEEGAFDESPRTKGARPRHGSSVSAGDGKPVHDSYGSPGPGSRTRSKSKPRK